MIKNPYEIDFSISNVRIAYDTKRSKPWHRSCSPKDFETNNIYKIYYFESGSAKTLFNGKEFQILEHSVTFANKSVGCYKKISNHLPTYSKSIIFRTAEPIPLLFDSVPFLTIKAKNPDYTSTLFSKALATYEEKPPFWNISLRRILLEIIREFLNTYYEIEHSKNIPEYLRKSVEFIKENACFSPIVIKELAEEYNISVDHFRRTFEHYYNVSPKRYINNIRLNRAASLLIGTEKSISEIAELSGFNNLSNFNSLFKEKFGMTPLKYRAKNDAIYL